MLVGVAACVVADVSGYESSYEHRAAKFGAVEHLAVAVDLLAEKGSSMLGLE